MLAFIQMLKDAIRGQAVTLCSTILGVLAFFSLGVVLTSGQEEGEIVKGLFPQLTCLSSHPGKPLIVFH